MDPQKYFSLKSSRPKNGISLSRETPGLKTIKVGGQSIKKLKFPTTPVGGFKPNPPKVPKNGMPSPQARNEQYLKVRQKSQVKQEIPERVKPFADTLMEKYRTSLRKRNYREVKSRMPNNL